MTTLEHYILDEVLSAARIEVYVGSLQVCLTAVEKCGQRGTSSSQGGREKSTEKHQPVSEGISWEPRTKSAHTGSQKTVKKISFQVTKNDMMVAEQV